MYHTWSHQDRRFILILFFIYKPHRRSFHLFSQKYGKLPQVITLCIEYISDEEHTLEHSTCPNCRSLTRQYTWVSSYVPGLDDLFPSEMIAPLKRTIFWAHVSTFLVEGAAMNASGDSHFCFHLFDVYMQPWHGQVLSKACVKWEETSKNGVSHSGLQRVPTCDGSVSC